MRILVTGAAGFVGSHVVRRALEEGHDITALVRPGADRRRLQGLEDDLRIVACELGDPADVERAVGSARPELCLHLAWRGSAGDGPEAGANVGSLIASLELVRALGRASCQRYVATGTCFEYADADIAHAEDEAASPRDLYALCKSASFQLTRELCRLDGISMAWPRIFYVYGPHEDRRRLVSSVIVALLEGRPIPTTPGAQVRDYLDVEDVADAIWSVARSRASGPVNVASGTPVTVRQIVEEIGRIVGRPDLPRIGELAYRPGEPMVIKADARLLSETVGWRPRHSLEDGLRRTVEWWRRELAPSGPAHQGGVGPTSAARGSQRTRPR